jgi:dUTP pyrophosphatase
MGINFITDFRPPKVRFLRVTEDKSWPLPSRGSKDAAGLDLSASSSFDLFPGKIVVVPTGWAVEIPPGFEGQIRPRSGLALRQGITVINAPGTIDSDYRGEIMVGLINHNIYNYSFDRGDRIAQLVISPCLVVDPIEAESLSETDRGEKGFGSTGV